MDINYNQSFNKELTLGNIKFYKLYQKAASRFGFILTIRHPHSELVISGQLLRTSFADQAVLFIGVLNITNLYQQQNFIRYNKHLQQG